MGELAVGTSQSPPPGARGERGDGNEAPTTSLTPSAPGSDDPTVSVAPTASVAYPHGVLTPQAQLLIGDGQYELTTYAADGIQRVKYLDAGTVAAAFLAQPLDTGWLPLQTLRAGRGRHGEFFVCLIPAARHTIRLHWEIGEELDEENDGAAEVHVDAGDAARPTAPGGRARRRGVQRQRGARTPLVERFTLPLPPFIWMGYGTTYACAALADLDLPLSPMASLCYPPLPNVYDNMGICWGVNVPPPVSARQMAVAWRLFIAESIFTRSLCEQRSRSHPRDVRVTLRRLSATQAPQYPLGDLMPVPGRVTLTNWVERFLSA